MKFGLRLVKSQLVKNSAPNIGDAAKGLYVHWSVVYYLVLFDGLDLPRVQVSNSNINQILRFQAHFEPRKEIPLESLV